MLIYKKPAGIVSIVFSLLAMLFVFAMPYQGAQGQTTTKTMAVTATLPVPAGITVEQDDNNARLSWGAAQNPNNPNPAPVTGYKITWGPAANPSASTMLTEYRSAQLQPLVNGQPYAATIQSVDSYGNLSAPSNPVNFTGDSSRVAALHTSMSGFFDDFDTPAGSFDELKWNQAYSHCNNGGSSSFINDQYHAHNMAASVLCDRGQDINRPRATFDFTGRTGTISFDFDGALGRDKWYLDLSPVLADITSHITVGEADTGQPFGMLRIKQEGTSLFVQQVDSTGKLTQVLKNGIGTPYSTLEWLGLPLIPNYRRHWVIQVSQSSINITIDGVTALAGPIAPPFSRATVQWNEFSYNTPKGNLPMNLIHWDNFGFDGPAPTTVTHNYRAAYGGTDYIKATATTPASATIQIPDSMAGDSAERLMFTIQPDIYQSYTWAASHYVSLNGVQYPIPQPATPVNMIKPFSAVVALPPGTLITGANQLSFSGANLAVLNIHMEADFPAGSAPSYTNPDTVYSTTTIPHMMVVGPDTVVNKVNGVNPSQGTPQVISGTIKVDATIGNQLALIATGKNVGLDRVELRIDRQVVKTVSLNAAPKAVISIDFDTAQVANGVHQLDIMAYSTNGAASIPNYFEQTTKQGQFYPFAIDVENAVTATATPTPTEAPTPTATVEPTATATPEPTATATATDTPQPTATVAPTPTVEPTATPTVSPTPTPEPIPAVATREHLYREFATLDEANTWVASLPGIYREVLSYNVVYDGSVYAALALVSL